MKKVKALFVGLNTVDMQFFVEGFPKPNTKTKAHRNEIAAGGPATNAAIASAFLGTETTLITPIGKHSLSRFLMDDIEKHKVKLIDPLEDIESKPVFASIITDEINGERTIFSYHPESNYSSILKELAIPGLADYNIALFDGFYLDLAIPIAKQLKELGVTIVLDGGSWKPGLEELLPYIDIAICSKDFKVSNAITEQEIFAELQKYGIQKAAITNGEKPIVFFDNNEMHSLPVMQTKIVDSLGAGDFFHGAFCYYYANRSTFAVALKQASLIATRTCEFHGTRKWMKHKW